jgi:hypothetical protein
MKYSVSFTSASGYPVSQLDYRKFDTYDAAHGAVEGITVEAYTSYGFSPTLEDCIEQTNSIEEAEDMLLEIATEEINVWIEEEGDE